MNIQINEELRGYIDPLTTNEYAALERSILAEGCRDALVVWGEVLIDGHNRHAICQKHGIEFKTVQNNSFASIEDVMLWMIDNHLARRSVSDFQRGVLALRKKDIVTARTKAQQENTPEAVTPDVSDAPVAPPFATRDEVAKVAGISSNTINQIEKIQKTAAPELVDAVRSGTISISAAAAVASLPSEEQVAAVAGGKKELRQAAKMAREMKSSSKPPKTEVPDEPVEPRDEVAVLTAKVAALTAENAALQEKVAALTVALEDARRAA